MMLLSVAIVAGRLVVVRPLDSVFVATSRDRQMLLAVVPAPSINSLPAMISYRAPVAGVNVKADSTWIVGVVLALFPVM